VLVSFILFELLPIKSLILLKNEIFCPQHEQYLLGEGIADSLGLLLGTFHQILAGLKGSPISWLSMTQPV